MPQLTVFSLLDETLKTLRARGRDLAGLMIIPVIVTALITAGIATAYGGQVGFTDPAALLQSLVALVVQTPAVAAWCRICLNADAPVDALGPVDSRASGLLRIEAMLLLIPLGLVIASGLVAGALGGAAQQGVAGLALVGMLAFIVILPRLMLALPAAALGAPDAGLKTAWAQGRGHTMPLLLSVMICLPPLFIVGAVVTAIASIGDGAFDEGGYAAAVWTALPAAFVGMMLKGVVTTVIVRAYASLSGRAAMNGSGSP